MSDQGGQVEYQTSELKVLQHHYDSAEGVYLLEVGREVHIAERLNEVPVIGSNGLPEVEDPEADPPKIKTTAELIPAELVGHIEVQDFKFDANDPRWFDADGKRLDESDVAAEQKQIIRDAISAAAAAPAADVSQPQRELPGVGEVL